MRLSRYCSAFPGEGWLFRLYCTGDNDDKFDKDDDPENPENDDAPPVTMILSQFSLSSLLSFLSKYSPSSPSSVLSSLSPVHGWRCPHFEKCQVPMTEACFFNQITHNRHNFMNLNLGDKIGSYTIINPHFYESNYSLVCTAEDNF